MTRNRPNGITAKNTQIHKTMADRKNLKIEPETYQRLRDAKGQYETWDGMLNRLVDEVTE